MFITNKMSTFFVSQGDFMKMKMFDFFNCFFRKKEVKNSKREIKNLGPNVAVRLYRLKNKI